MGSTSFNFFSDSPTMILSSQEPPRPFVDPSPFHQPDPHSHTPNNFSQWTPSSSRTPVCTAPSRKRPRDESTLAEHDSFHDGSYFPATHTPPPTIPKHEPIYGEGMTLLNPTTGLAVSAESQTGTWFEEATAATNLAHTLHPPPPSSSTSTTATEPEPRTRPILKPALSSRKSQRLDTTAPGPDDITLATLASHHSTGRSPPKTTRLDPAVDDSTHLLGIGWTRLRADDPAADADVQAAARGWAKYINNHYPGVADAQILLQSKGLSAYLVAASGGFWLFREDLSEGRLVGGCWETCLASLRGGMAGLEGGEVVRAVRTPGEHHGGGGGGDGFKDLRAGLQGPAREVGDVMALEEGYHGLGGGGGMDLD